MAKRTPRKSKVTSPFKKGIGARILAIYLDFLETFNFRPKTTADDFYQYSALSQFYATRAGGMEYALYEARMILDGEGDNETVLFAFTARHLIPARSGIPRVHKDEQIHYVLLLQEAMFVPIYDATGGTSYVQNDNDPSHLRVPAELIGADHPLRLPVNAPRPNQILELLGEIRKDLAEVTKLREFKRYVHDRLDKMGIPSDPESPHKAEGCRIGGRLDVVESQLKDITPAEDAAIDEGFEAYERDVEPDSRCPYTRNDPRREHWHMGWDTAAENDRGKPEPAAYEPGNFEEPLGSTYGVTQAFQAGYNAYRPDQLVNNPYDNDESSKAERNDWEAGWDAAREHKERENATQR